MSRQGDWQQKKHSQGRCVQCGKKIVGIRALKKRKTCSKCGARASARVLAAHYRKMEAQKKLTSEQTGGKDDLGRPAPV